jgi:hypothetical protein
MQSSSNAALTGPLPRLSIRPVEAIRTMRAGPFGKGPLKTVAYGSAVRGGRFPARPEPTRIAREDHIMADDREQRIRDHAYRLWEAEGRPHGRHDTHWHDATRTVDDEAEADIPADPVTIPPAADPVAEQAPLVAPDVDQLPAATAPPPKAAAAPRRAPAKGRGRKSPA